VHVADLDDDEVERIAEQLRTRFQNDSFARGARPSGDTGDGRPPL
jgi:hypothetical protein